MTISPTLLEIREHTEAGYKPLIDYGNWRVAILNFSADLLPENITALQRHNETDEVFVLLQGRCLLFIGEGQEAITAVHGQEMLPGTVYNVKKGVWHSHTLSSEAMVLVVENRDTTYVNSPFSPLSADQQAALQQLTRKIFG
jgi:mannose-6-phosphate isomerase-like protein (cupin superfamily)